MLDLASQEPGLPYEELIKQRHRLRRCIADLTTDRSRMEAQRARLGKDKVKAVDARRPGDQTGSIDLLQRQIDAADTRVALLQVAEQRLTARIVAYEQRNWG
jgi:hypothetical protein